MAKPKHSDKLPSVANIFDRHQQTPSPRRRNSNLNSYGPVIADYDEGEDDDRQIQVRHEIDDQKNWNS